MKPVDTPFPRHWLQDQLTIIARNAAHGIMVNWSLIAVKLVVIALAVLLALYYFGFL
jgi:hypothetical protein